MPPFQTDFSSAFSHTLQYVACGGADISECREAASQIHDGDCESWHLAWVRLAEKVRRQAGQNLAHGQKRDVRDAFLRAAQYYRTAGHFFYRNPGDARIATTAEASAACFATAMRLSMPTGETHNIEHDGLHHTAYLHRADESSEGTRPTLLVIGEESTTALGLYFSCAVAARRCGWHCLTVSSASGGEGAADFAPLFMAAAKRLDGVNPACLALMLFLEEAALPPDVMYRRSVQPVALGTATHVGAALMRPKNHPLLFHSLKDLHEWVFQWLGSSEPR